MRSLKSKTLIAALAAFALLLGGSGCNNLGDDPKIADAYVQVTAITYTGTSIAVIEDVVAKIKFDLKFRDSTTNSNAMIQFDTFTYSGMISGTPVSGSGLTNTVQYSAPSAGNLILLNVVPAGSRVLGSVDSITVHIDGRDLTNDRPINLDVNLTWAISP
jgi:hypothetical protein